MLEINLYWFHCYYRKECDMVLVFFKWCFCDSTQFIISKKNKSLLESYWTFIYNVIHLLFQKYDLKLTLRCNCNPRHSSCKWKKTIVRFVCCIDKLILLQWCIYSINLFSFINNFLEQYICWIFLHYRKGRKFIF